MRPVRRFIHDSALSLFFLVLFAAALLGQSFAGLAETNDELAEHGQAALGYWDFVFSSRFAVDVAENWQSEFLQFFLFILATVWLVQRGSPESKEPGDEGIGSEKEQRLGRFAKPGSPSWARKARGWQRTVYENSLLIVMGLIFLFSWFAQSLAGMVVANEDRAMHGQPPLSWPEYLVDAEFWNRTLQNWQSELLAVGAMVAFAIYLRQRGSHESKPVGTPHAATAASSD